MKKLDCASIILKFRLYNLDWFVFLYIFTLFEALASYIVYLKYILSFYSITNLLLFYHPIFWKDDYFLNKSTSLKLKLKIKNKWTK